MGFSEKFLAGADSALRQGAAMLSRVTRRAAISTYNDLKDPGERRKFLRQMATAGGGALLTAAVFRYGMQEGSDSVEQSSKTCPPKSQPIEFEFAELTQNRVGSFEVVWGGLDKNHVVFIDQLGNVIQEPIKLEPISLSNGKVIPRFDKKTGAINQSWLDWHRSNLVQKYPTVFHKPGSFPELYTPRKMLLAEDPGTTVLDLTWQNSQEEICYKKSKKDSGLTTSRLNFSRQVFSWSKVLPKDLQETLSLGIPSVESSFRDEAVSEAGAVGAFQMLEDAATEAGLFIGYRDVPDNAKFKELKRKQETERLKAKKSHKKFKPKKIPMPMKRVFIDERKFFVSAALGSMRYFESLYQQLGSLQPLLSICARFKLQPSEFLYPCIINSYHSGKTRILRMLTWFDKNFSTEDVKKEIGEGPYGMDIFTFMSQNYRDSGVDSGYGRRSWGYPIQVMAMADLMKNRLADPNYKIDPFSSEDPYEAPPEVEETLLAGRVKHDRQHGFLYGKIPFGVGVAVGTTAGLVVEANESESVTRREVFGILRKSVLGSVVGTVGVDLFASKNQRLAPSEELLPSVIVQPQHIERQVGTQSFAESLLTRDHLISNKEFHGTDLPRRQQSVTNKFIESVRPQRFANFAQVKTAAGNGHLETLDEKSSDYRLYNLGTKIKGVDGPNASDLLRCINPHTKDLLHVISEEVNELLHKEAGLDSRYKVRLIISSAIRPKTYNERLRPRSSTKSSHQYGIAADIANTRFDLIDTKTGASYAVTENSCDPINKKFRATVFCRAALYRVIRKMHNEGKIIAMLEGGHVHFTDKHFRS